MSGVREIGLRTVMNKIVSAKVVTMNASHLYSYPAGSDPGEIEFRPLRPIVGA